MRFFHLLSVKIIIALGLLAACSCIILVIIFYSTVPPRQPTFFGVSFSPVYARYLGLDPELVFNAILNEWGFKYIRLSARWDEIERNRGEFNFAKLDNLMETAARHQARVILVVGQKTPRWPECHLPEWAIRLTGGDYTDALKQYMAKVVERYKDHPALEFWQVENEPFLPFGICPSQTPQDLAAEINLVKKFDPAHRVVITDTGELSLWLHTVNAGDIFGSTAYRIVWDKRLGYLHYDPWLPADMYRFKLWLNRRSPERAFVVELQGEPWLPDRPVNDTALEEQYKSLNPERLQKNIRFAQDIGWPRAYLWGAEWWYWVQKKHGVNDFIDQVKRLPKE